MESHLRDGVSLSVSQSSVLSTGTRQSVSSRIFSPEHWKVLKAAVNHGYYERSWEVSDLASILDEPRSTVQYRLRTAEDRMCRSLSSRHSSWGHRRNIVPYALRTPASASEPDAGTLNEKNDRIIELLADNE
nr:helix-turn-helix domain-containing protein [Haladaptatus cibarius]